jgi:hypothetical protein
MKTIEQISFRLKKSDIKPVNDIIQLLSEQYKTEKLNDIVIRALKEASQPPPTSDEKDIIIKGLEREIEEEKNQRKSIDEQVINQIEKIAELEHKLVDTENELNNCRSNGADVLDALLLNRHSAALQPMLEAYERRKNAGKPHTESFESFVCHLFEVIADAASPDELLKPRK